MINLKKWYENHPSPKRNGKRYDSKLDTSLNSLQKEHVQGDINIYETIITHTEKWVHLKEDGIYGRFIAAEPVPHTRVQNNLPPVYLQWKEDYRKRRLCESNNRPT